MALQATAQVQVNIGEVTPTVHMQVLTAENIPTEIFVYEQTLEKDELGCYISKFDHVASLTDLDNYAATSPAVGQALFRQDSIDLTFDTFKEAFDYYNLIQEDINSLICARTKQLLFSDTDFIDMFPKGNCCI
jgi:hypothetical protein